MDDFKLGWRKTWEEQDDEDYVYCDDSGTMFGRVYFDQNKFWKWFFSSRSGLADSRREAMLAVEEAYEAVKG